MLRALKPLFGGDRQRRRRRQPEVEEAVEPQLHRVIMAEATRFPDLAVAMAERSAGREAIERISALLQREASSERLSDEMARFAAIQFMQMVIASPQRRALGQGVAMSNRELDTWATQTVSLFLGGYRGWTQPSRRSRR